MAEIIPKVYDIFRPNPQKLQELAAITICLEIWRYELKKLRTSDTWENFEPRPHATNILLKTYLPGLPSGIYRILDNYVEILGNSLTVWAGEHYLGILRACCSNHLQSYKDLFKYFDDFVCGYGGTIHFDRTAKRMMQCQRFDLNEKFAIACVYFFEDSIEEMWPLVSENELWRIRRFKFSEYPHLSYWICRLRNILNKLTFPNCSLRDYSVDEFMFGKYIPLRALGPMNYFWNRMPLENRMRNAYSFFEGHMKGCFVEHILPRLDDQQIAEIVNEKCSDIMHSLLQNARYDEEFTLRTWMHIRKFTSVRDFTRLVVKMLLNEVILMKWAYAFPERDSDSLVYMCREIWNSIPNNFKRSAIRDILSNSKLFKKRCSIIHDFQLYSNDVEFIFTILYDASFKEKSSFWHKCWHHLILEIRSEDLQRMMKICFRYECEITQFKEKVIATNANVHRFCVSLLLHSHFGKLNKFIDFLWSDIQAARNFKQQILRSAFFTGNYCYVNLIIVRNPKYFDEFFNDAYNNVDLSNDFKCQLMLSPLVQSCLSDYARSFCCLDEIMEFIDIFALREETLLQIKMRMIDSLKERLSSDGMSQRDSRLLELSNKFLLWCLGSEEEVTKFKLSFAPESGTSDNSA